MIVADTVMRLNGGPRIPRYRSPDGRRGAGLSRGRGRHPRGGLVRVRNHGERKE